MTAIISYLIIAGILSICQVLQAQVDGGWSEWGALSPLPCSITCGGAEQQAVKTRECNNPLREGEGKPCPGLPFEFTTLPVLCGTDACPDPVDGGWSSWSQWMTSHPCTVTCGGSDIERARSRECTNPPRQHGGAKCPGFPFDVDYTPCSPDPCPGMVDGVWSSWGQWVDTPCPVSCGGSTALRNRTRQCDNPAPQNGGEQCPGVNGELLVFQCGKDPCPGMVDGVWSSWGHWVDTPCPVSCGGSTALRNRTRQCDNPAPQNGGEQCPGVNGELLVFQCGKDPCPGMVDGVWSSWGQWVDTPCPVSCGGSTALRNRTRQCDNPAPQNGGEQCPGVNGELLVFQCGKDPCPGTVDGVWSSWGQWVDTPCPVSCGGSTALRNRTRQCDNPAPQNGGEQCPGVNGELLVFQCGKDPCPGMVDGVWSSWGQWVDTPCPVSCGGSTALRNRTRQCDNPAPQNGGEQCPGVNGELLVFQCGEDPCPVNEGWSSWSPWITPPCPVSCGAADGTVVDRTRTRVCNLPTSPGGAQCPGSDTLIESWPCGSQPCAGEWTSWGEWGAMRCSATCGWSVMGTSTRSRTCSGVEGHTECVGVRKDTRSLGCKLSDCPEHTSRSEWYDYLSDDARRAIIGVVVAVGIFFLLVIIVLICLLCRRNRKLPASQLSLQEGLKSGTASGARFKEGRWHQAFVDTPQSS